MLYLYRSLPLPIKRVVKRLYKGGRGGGLRLSEAFGVDKAQRFFISPDSFDLLTINPRLIVNCVKREISKKGFVWEGDWDIDDVASLNRARPEVYEAVYDIFVHGKPYVTTRQYKEMSHAVDLYLQGKTNDPAAFGAYWCRTHEDIDEYFAKLARAYHSIRTEGYRSQKEIALMRPGDSQGMADEIQVVIGRSGDFILANGGTHRTLITKILGIDTVPVRVIAVHERFLAEESDGAMSLRNTLNERLWTLARSRQAALTERHTHTEVAYMTSIH